MALAVQHDDPAAGVAGQQDHLGNPQVALVILVLLRMASSARSREAISFRSFRFRR